MTPQTLPFSLVAAAVVAGPGRLKDDLALEFGEGHVKVLRERVRGCFPGIAEVIEKGTADGESTVLEEGGEADGVKSENKGLRMHVSYKTHNTSHSHSHAARAISEWGDSLDILNLRVVSEEMSQEVDEDPDSQHSIR